MLKTMKNMLLCGFVFVCLPVFMWAASEGFTVAGEVSFTESGDIRVRLVTKEEFEQVKKHGKDQEAETPKDSEDASFSTIINIGEEELKLKKVSFKFENVPAGTYGIRAFQDVNGNGKMDMGMLGPKEPWGMYRSVCSKFRPPKFEEIAFEVQDDISDIAFEVTKGNNKKE